MRRADRLFQIIQILRRSTRPVTAAALAAELEVSIRTVYRDVADLAAQNVPIAGAAGYGYVLGADFDMPPLMLTRDEIEAVMLGAQWVADRGDKALRAAARDVMTKIAAVLPEALRSHALAPGVGPKPPDGIHEDAIDCAVLRAAIHSGHKLRLRYRTPDGPETERVVWPVVVGYADMYRMLIAWCELRGDFRHFRTDRILAADIMPDRVGETHASLRHRWEVWRMAQAASER